MVLPLIKASVAGRSGETRIMMCVSDEHRFQKMSDGLGTERYYEVKNIRQASLQYILIFTEYREYIMSYKNSTLYD